MNIRELARRSKAARKEKTPGFREYISICPNNRVLCESKSHYDFLDTFGKALAEGHVKPEELSIRELFIELVEDGRELLETWNPKYGGGVSLVEAGGAITSSDFSNITGQIVYNALIEDFMAEEFVFSNMIPTQSTQFDGEKIAGIANLGDQAEVTAELDQFPLVGTSEDWIETPRTTKRGLMVPITKEAIFFDRTGDLLNKARQVGQSLGLNKEKRAIDCLIDENTTTHRYKWRGTTYATYQTTTPWDNVTASTALLDWTDIDAANQTLNGITDPNTGEPVVIEADTLVCTKDLELTAKRIANATSVKVVTPGYATSANPNETETANPVGTFSVVTSRLLATRLATDTHWFYGNPRKAFTYMENWPITVTEEPGDPRRDIVSSFKCSERGQYATLQPRYMSKATQ